MMNLDDYTEVLINLDIDAMVWQWGHCPFRALIDVYVPNGFETHVALSTCRSEYFTNRIRSCTKPPEEPPVVTLLINDYYLLHIISSYDKVAQHAARQMHEVEVREDGYFSL